MKKFRITKNSRVYNVVAKDHKTALNAVNKIKDERLSPMTYKKLGELGYTSEDWQNLTQEDANKIVAEGKGGAGTKGSPKAESNKGQSKSVNQSNANKQKPKVTKFNPDKPDSIPDNTEVTLREDVYYAPPDAMGGIFDGNTDEEIIAAAEKAGMKYDSESDLLYLPKDSKMKYKQSTSGSGWPGLEGPNGELFEMAEGGFKMSYEGQPNEGNKKELNAPKNKTKKSNKPEYYVDPPVYKDEWEKAAVKEVDNVLSYNTNMGDTEEETIQMALNTYEMTYGDKPSDDIKKYIIFLAKDAYRHFV